MSQHLKRPCIRNSWLKLLTIVLYALWTHRRVSGRTGVPALRDYVFVNWVRLKASVHIEKKNPERLRVRSYQCRDCRHFQKPWCQKIERSDSNIQEFDKVVLQRHRPGNAVIRPNRCRKQTPFQPGAKLCDNLASYGYIHVRPTWYPENQNLISSRRPADGAIMPPKQTLWHLVTPAI